MTALPVGLDGRALGDASAYRGLGTYVRGLLSGLAERGDRVEVTALVRPGVAVPAGIRSRPARRVAPDRWATWEHHRRLPGEIRRLAPAVWHSPALDPPAHPGRPLVQTVADVLPLADPHPALAVERRRWERWAPRVRAAEAVITFSAFAAEELTEHLQVDPGRIHVIPLAPDPRYRPGPQPGGGEDGGGGGGRDGAGDPYLLYVGEYGPHKGFAAAGRLMAEVDRLGLPHRLVMAGRVAPARRTAVEAELAAAGPAARGRITVANWVDDLLPLYRGAAALVMTSEHEGFGLPAVEAMACGTPVVGFANSALPEVVGSGGTLVADGDVSALAQAVAKLVADPDAHRAASEAARARASAFDWAVTVEGHIDLYYRAAGRAP